MKKDDRNAEWYLSNPTKEDRKKKREKFARFIEAFTKCFGRNGRYFLSEIVSDPDSY